MDPLLPSEVVHSIVNGLLLSGQARSAHEAEEMFLDAHLSQIARLVIELDDHAFEEHEVVKLLMAHGSRRLEDALR